MTIETFIVVITHPLTLPCFAWIGGMLSYRILFAEEISIGKRVWKQLRYNAPKGAIIVSKPFPQRHVAFAKDLDISN